MRGKRARPAVEQDCFEVERIVARREPRPGTTEYLVKWQGYPEADNTWEPAAHLPAHLVAAFDKSHSPAPTAKRAGGCAYERRRAARIERNQQVLSGLGLQPRQRMAKGSPGGSSRPRRKQAKVENESYSEPWSEDDDREAGEGETEEPRTGRWRPFAEALEYVRSLGLSGKKEWREWSKSGARPADIPTNPNRTYAGQGWQSWGHWLGTGNMHTKEFRPFGEALEFVHSLGLSGKKEWSDWCKSGARPTDIPSAPNKMYAGQGWQGWGHWLGTGTVAPHNREYRPFAEALELIQSLRLPGKKEWCEWSKSDARPADIPSNPHRTYAGQGWQGYGHWLGTSTVPPQNREFRPFGEALEFAQSLGLSGKKEWYEWCKSGARPADIPSNPNRVYAGQGWQSWGHWLGTGNVYTKDFRPFAEALEFVRSLGLTGETAWREWSKSGARPADIPSRPYQVYARQGWQSLRHWLGTGDVRKKEYRPFGEALEFARSLGLSGTKAWQEWRKSGARPADIPSAPERTYAGQGWQGMGHWLGTGDLREKGFRPFGEALEFARSLRLRGENAWREWCKSDARPADIPSNPYKTYAGQGWQGYGHWLGTGNVRGGNVHKKEFRPFGEALEFARSLGLSGTKAWQEWSKSGARPADIPSSPNQVYAGQGWQGMGHWLGTGDLRKKEFRPFGEALEFAQSLGLSDKKEWQEWSKSDARPADIPSSPNQVYAGQGWQGMGHWLGTGDLRKKEFRPCGRPSTRRAPTRRSMSAEESLSDDSSEEPNVTDDSFAHLSEDETEDSDDGDSFEVERLVARRERRQAGTTEYLAKWQGYPEADNTWEPAAHLPAHLVAAFDKSHSPAQPVARAGGCAYERRRAARIERNQQVLSGLGLQPRQSKFRPFVDALALVRSLELYSLAEWRKWSKSDSKPADIPDRPHMAYAKQGWRSYDHWLNAENQLCTIEI